ncbi:MAG: hypothetical protein K2W96_11885 [Gemmataceae bacterium]|nr:hypothetical protein [Gemmataceae bacterium]
MSDPWQLLADAHRRVWRASEALTRAGIRHAVIGSHAVDHWVSRAVGANAMFSTRVNILVERGNAEAAQDALIVADAWPIRLRFAGERPEGWYCPLPPLDDVAEDGDRRVIGLGTLVRMLLGSWRLIDRVHLGQFAVEGLIGPAWTRRFRGGLAERLQHLLDNPEG